jgi:hypothetical protein
MKTIIRFTSITVFLALVHFQTYAQTFQNTGEAKRFFEKMDYDHNKAMVTGDSSFLPETL